MRRSEDACGGDHALFVGDTVYDSTVRVRRLPGPDEKVVGIEVVDAAGGVVTNAAVACARTGIPARLCSALGTDAAARACHDELVGLGVEADAETVEGAANRAVISLAADGEKQLVLVPGVRMYPSPEACRDLDLDGVAWVHTAVYDVAAAEVLRDRCAAAGIPWSIDLEPATFETGIEALAPHLKGAAVAFCNSRAAAAIGPDPSATLLSMGVAAVVRSDGAAGARWVTLAGEQRVSAPNSVVPVVDTTGAGDCLAGSFVGLMIETGDPAVSLRYAVRAASRSCGALGGHRSYPSREEM